jgi:hypothetical protein
MPDTMIHKDDSNHIEPVPPPAEWDIAPCRAKRIGFSDYVTCLSDKKHLCQYTLFFGAHVYCLHPLRQEIVEQTEADGNNRWDDYK